ncbi:MAG TPA: hypothetical protein VG738_06790 [Chitinophagaceae bacterium]|nr:hypothetical protein [Chitinophagaceae bacterium]
MKNKWLYFISPCVIAVIILTAGVLMDTTSGGWHMLGVVAGLPLIAIIAVAGIIMKLLIRKSIALLWIIEILVLLCIFITSRHLK